jgi:hypothetical protein
MFWTLDLVRSSDAKSIRAGNLRAMAEYSSNKSALERVSRDLEVTVESLDV